MAVRIRYRRVRGPIGAANHFCSRRKLPATTISLYLQAEEYVEKILASGNVAPLTPVSSHPTTSSHDIPQPLVPNTVYDEPPTHKKKEEGNGPLLNAYDLYCEYVNTNVLNNGDHINYDLTFLKPVISIPDEYLPSQSGDGGSSSQSVNLDSSNIKKSARCKQPISMPKYHMNQIKDAHINEVLKSYLSQISSNSP